MKSFTIAGIVTLAAAVAVAAGIAALPENNVKAAEGDVEIIEGNFPDVNFRNWLSTQSYGKDGVITKEEISKITKITIEFKQVSSLDGIGYFTELKELHCLGNRLEKLDLSKNTKLVVLECNQNKISDLNISNNAELTDLNCRNNQLTELDLRSNPKLKEVDCAENKLIKVDLSNNSLLESFGCYHNSLTSLDLSKNTALTSLNCGYNSLEDLDVSGNTALTRLGCAINQLTSLDLSKNVNLSSLDILKNKFTTIDLSKNTSLTTLSCGVNPLTGLDLRNNVLLDYISCYSTTISSIDLSRNTALEYVYIYRNEHLSSLDLSKNTAVKELNCSDNNLTDLTLGKKPLLSEIHCDNNSLTSLDISGCEALTNISCYGNKLKEIDLSKCPELKQLSCGNNLLKEIDLSKCPEITNMSCNKNQIKILDMSWNEKLLYFNCEDNQIKNLDVSENTYLATLYCKGNPLTKVYTPSASDYFRSGDIPQVILTPADWKYTGVEWKVDKNDPSKTTAFAKFQCIKEGEEDYTCSRPMTIKHLSLPEDICLKGGKVEYEVEISAFRSRTKKAISESKKFDFAAGHRWDSWKSTKKASVGVAAVDTHTCLICKTKETRNPEAIVICGRNLTLKDTFKGESSVTWKSSNSKIATVDSKGKITTKMAGKVTISATASGKTEKCVVTVLYKDVTNTGDFWYAPTNYLTAKGVVKGYANQTEFRPANECTRAQMVTFLYRLQGEPKTKSNKCKFDDVKSGDYFYKPVIWAVEQGITTGVSENKFAPQKVCTRAQTVTFLWRMAGKPEPGKNAKTFSDVNKKDYFYKATLWASEKKILAGYDDNTFRPQGKCLRRQMVTFLYKYDKFVNNR